GLTITSPYTVRRSANSTIGPAQAAAGLNNFAFSGTSPAEDRNVVVWGIAMELLINDDGQYGMAAGMTTDHVRSNAIGNHLEYPNNYFQCGLKAYEIRVNNVWYTLVWSGISDTLEANKSQPSLRGLKVERTGNTADGVHKGLRLHQVDAHIRVTKDTGQNPLCEQRIVG